MKIEDILSILAAITLTAMLWANIDEAKVIQQQQHLIVQMYADCPR